MPVIVPKFSEAEMKAGHTDFNDLAQSRGRQSMRDVIKAELDAAYAAQSVDIKAQAQGQAQDQTQEQAAKPARKAAAKKARGASAEMAM